MREILQKIENANTLEDLNQLRLQVIRDRTEESLRVWRKKYLSLGGGIPF